MMPNTLQTPSVQPCPQSPATDDTAMEKLSRQRVSLNGRNTKKNDCSGALIGAGHGGHSLSNNRLCSFALRAIQTGGSLMCNAAEFTLGQVMESDDIQWLCPDLKQSLVALAALTTLLPTTRAGMTCKKLFSDPDHGTKYDCPYDCFDCVSPPVCYPKLKLCNGKVDCKPDSDEKGCDEKRCKELGRPFLYGNSTCSNTPYSTTPPPVAEPTSSSLKSNFSPSPAGITNFTPSSTRISQPPTSFFKPITNSTKTFPLRTTTSSIPGDSSESVSSAIIGTMLILGALTILYCVCSYQSYRVMRRNDDESSTCQLMGRALANPLHFHTHQ
ncbi:LDL receptor domain-containing protein [Endozoicomonas sp. ONNA2]|uniref:LDL receptor domain-containing protein n=1 Tax=Endozoicomonas sp. ONNA2 TaxID=2828741 RepID=UPI0021484E18|nr:LDL receptor domain-containing protein [Endozoicomonas sp. ONNA2]